jgi:hypothetical protein
VISLLRGDAAQELSQEAKDIATNTFNVGYPAAGKHSLAQRPRRYDLD